MNRFRNSILIKPTAVFMAFTFMVFTFMPNQAFALGSGPNQPELESFSPIGMDNMVNLFTGDFSYNLPLMTVPGPNGGYPINMNYSAGVGMEQEASWVGLGWNLNPGVINRELRGLPDDLNGQKVRKTLSQKKNWTLSANMGGSALADAEFFGADLGKLANAIGVSEAGGNGSLTVSYNSYSGPSADLGLGLSFQGNKQNKPPLGARLEQFLDTLQGSLLGSWSFLDQIEESESTEERKEGMSSDRLSFNRNISNRILSSYNNPVGAFTRAAQVDIQDIRHTHPFTSGSYSFNGKVGSVLLGYTGDLRATYMYQYQKIADDDKVIDVPAYGYLYSDQNAADGNKGLMDFALMNQSMLTPDSKVLPIPNHSNDIFHVKSQGVSGTVRPYKGGVSLLTDPKVISKSTSLGGGAEFNSLPPSIKVGVNLNGGAITSYNGPWVKGTQDISFLEQDLDAKTEDEPLLEPFYFQFANELTAETNPTSMFSRTGADGLKLGKQGGVGGAVPRLEKSFFNNASALSATNAFRNQRTKRAKQFFSLTEKEALQYDGANYPRILTDVETGNAVDADLSETGDQSSQMGAVHIADEGGTRYIYGIPAKNKVHKSVTFSVSHPGYGSTLGSMVPKSVAYNQGVDNSVANAVGTDNHYSATELPPYAHSFLLTEILSEDYADLTDNGPSTDDFGDYVKFDYFIHQDFKSRSTNNGAAYMPGNLANTGDDKASYTYFEKDLFYTKSIKTKTHIAVFDIMNDRFDAKGVASENASLSTAGKNQVRLKKITLYNLKEYEASPSSAKPIKTVNFGYSYTLCNGALNSSTGKLTLDSVWFTVGDQATKASLSPYVFKYDTNNNPAYNERHVDRWGSFQPDTANSFGSNVLYPYSTQNKNHANVYAGAWNLKEIKLPTGGKITIEYEADDYQYVQHRHAQNMYEIVGFDEDITGTPSNLLNEDNLYMVVDVGKQITAAEMDDYLEGLEELYFKSFLVMKPYGQEALKPATSSPFVSGNNAVDFVDGYLKFDRSDVHLYDPSAYTSNRIAIKVAKQGGRHPVKRQGWVALQTDRSDLLNENSFDGNGLESLGAATLGKIGQIIGSAISFLIDDSEFFRKAEDRGWCNQLEQSTGSLPSIVRLNSPGAKVGGGHRVKEININDAWYDMNGGASRDYGQRYSYELKDGTSSGVAQYEPIVGGEENPFRRPVRYSTNRVLFKNNDLYVEEPLAEGLFPSAVVGYSRVVVTNKANDVVTTSGEGVKVHEYYTAKDYPTRVQRTSINKVNTDLGGKLIVFIGGKSFSQPGFSQGFSAELNDMHGKQKAQSNFSAYADINEDEPISKTEYYYKTKDGYHPNKVNQLSSTADVFFADGLSKVKEVGKTVDVSLYTKESNTQSVNGAIDVNVDFTPPFAFTPTAWPNLDYSFTMTRLAMMAKVVNRTAILEKVVNTTNGAETITEHLAYDEATGAPVVSAVTNDYGNQIYNYKQKARWAYREMGGSYQNIGMKANDAIEANALVSGDVLMNTAGDKVWVESTYDLTTNSTTKRYWQKDGTQVQNSEITSGDYRVVYSGYGNNLSADFGSIQTTIDPRLLDGNLSIFKAYNAQIAGTNHTSFTYTDCKYGFTATNTIHNMVSTLFYKQGFRQGSNMTPELYNIAPAGYTHTIYIRDQGTSGLVYNPVGGTPNVASPNDQLSIPLNFKTDLDHPNTNEFKLYYLGDMKMLAVHPDGYEVEFDYYGDASCFDPLDCFGKCLEDVLNTSAQTFSDTLKSDVDLNNSITGLADNPYAYGFKGVFKPAETFYYPAVREQVQASANPWDFHTNISADGEYNEYAWFEPQNNNARWKRASSVTAYDFNGMPVEEKNALDNYSAVLYGHNRSLPIAVAANSRYTELAYNGFEDYGITGVTDGKANHLSTGSNTSLTSEAHTGAYGIQINTPNPVNVELDQTNGLDLQDGETYLIHAWHKKDSGGELRAFNGSVSNIAKSIAENSEGWELLEVVFTAGIDINRLTLDGENSIFDDIKVQPFNASVKTYVYDERTHQLIAALDENHYATLYNYDRDQVLRQVKKETERGIKTIQSTIRNNSQIQP